VDSASIIDARLPKPQNIPSAISSTFQEITATDRVLIFWLIANIKGAISN
jgi:hypothetical protein